MVAAEKIASYNPNHTEVPYSRFNQLNSLLRDERYINIVDMARKRFAQTFGFEAKIDIHGHEKSEAVYLAEFIEGDHMYYLSAMGPNEGTSPSHFHEWPQGRALPREISQMGGKRVNMAENYHLIKGRAVLELEDADRGKHEVILDQDNPSYTVNSGVKHRVRTEGEPALLALKTWYAALLEPNQVHIRPEEV